MAEKILIIEDDVSILRGLKDNLALEGYQVLESSDFEFLFWLTLLIKAPFL